MTRQSVTLTLHCDFLNLSDKKVSEKLQAEIEREAKESASLEEKRGEEEAMRVAIEERRRIKAIAEEKKKIEKADAEFAKKSILEEIDERHRIEELCEKDEDFAKQVIHH